MILIRKHSKNIENILISMIFIILNMCVVFAILIILNSFLLNFNDVFLFFYVKHDTILKKKSLSLYPLLRLYIIFVFLFKDSIAALEIL